jgi:hypothetical protein
MKITLPTIFFGLLQTTAVVGAANNYDEKAARRTILRQVNNEAPAVKQSNLGSQVHQARTNEGVKHINVSSPQQGTKTTNNQNYDNTHIVGGASSSPQQGTKITNNQNYDTHIVEGVSCVELTMELVTDSYPDDNDFLLVTDDEEIVWYESSFDATESYKYFACLDPTRCATLNFFDFSGDGIEAPGGITLTYDGTVLMNQSGAIEGGVVFRLGDGC